MSKKKIKVQTIKITDVPASLIEQMWDLYNSTYDFVCKEQFLLDFKAKSHVFIARDSGTNEFKGFSTLRLYMTNFRDERIGVIFSGDTIIHPDYWGTKSLHKEFIKFSFLWKIKNPMKKLYWNLIASGNRTYLAMARNCHTYYPRHDKDTPEWEKSFITHIGQDQFGANFNQSLGVIEVNKPEAILKSFLAPFTSQIKTLPEINFFINSNPGYEKGDELSCIAPINGILVIFFCKKVLRKYFSRPKEELNLNKDPILNSVVLILTLVFF